MGLVKTELEKVKEEKEGFEFKLAKFEKSSKDLEDLLASQVTDKSKRGFGYTVVPSPHPLILNRPTPLDLSYSGLEEFKQPEVNGYGPRDSSLKPTTVCDRESNNSKENTDDSLTQQPKTVTETSSVVSPFKSNTDAPIIEDWVSDDEEEVESIPKEEKKADVPTDTKKESVKLLNQVEEQLAEKENLVDKRLKLPEVTWTEFKNHVMDEFLRNQNRVLDKLASLMAKVDEVSYDGNTASLQVNTGSRVISTVAPEVNTATSEGLIGPIPTTEDTQEEDQGIDLGNISPSYAISSTPHTRIHKDHPIDHVIGQQRKKGILVVKINMSIDPEEVPTTQMVKISTFELVAYTDSDYAGATLDRKSTTRDLLTKGFDAGRFQLHRFQVLEMHQIPKAKSLGVLRNLWVSEMRRNESVEYSIYHATSQRHRRLVSLDEEFCVCGSIIEVGGGLMKDSLGMKIYGCVFGLDSWEKNLVRKEVSLKPRDAVKDVIAESWRGFVEHVDGLYLNRVGTHTDVIGSLQIEEDIIENEWFAYQAKIEVSRCWGLEGYSGVIEVCRVVVVCKGKVWWGIMVGNVMVCGDGKGYVVYGGERNSGDNEKWIVGEWGWGMVLSECGLIISVLDTHTAWIEVVGEGRGEADTHYLWESESQAYGVLLLEMGEGHSDYTVYEHEDGSIRNNGTDTDGLSQFRGRRSIVRLSGLDFVGGEESIDDASLNHFRERRQRCLAVSIVNLMGGWGKFGWDCDDDDTGVDL
ncbi:hypothetical protein Tco_0013868 [Tanacetum coccineum]